MDMAGQSYLDDLEELAFYNANKEFKPERGDFTIFIGGDCYADMSVGIKIV